MSVISDETLFAAISHFQPLTFVTLSLNCAVERQNQSKLLVGNNSHCGYRAIIIIVAVRQSSTLLFAIN